jgi:hypothetical protein
MLDLGWGTLDPSDPSFVWIALAYGLTAAVVGTWLTAAERRGASPWIALAPAIAIALATLLRIAATSGIDADESEHLHLAFAIGRDVMPYRDLDQNHMPALWLASAPLLSLLPETPYVLLLFRLLCLTSFALAIALACRLSGRLVRGGPYQAPLCVVLGLAFAVQAEFYRFRPDAFMNVLAMASLYLLLRPSKPTARPLRDALFAGMLQGLAVAFSPKVGHLALAVPLLFWLRSPSSGSQSERLRAMLSATLVYGAGFALALAPGVLWLAWQGLLADAYDGIVARNYGYASRRLAAPAPQNPGIYNTVLERARLAEMAVFFVCTLAGAALAATRKAVTPGLLPLGLRRAVVLTLLLWMSLWTFTPNAATYHIAGALILGSSLAAGALASLAVRWRSFAGRVALGCVIALCLGTAPLRSGIGGFVRGYSYPLGDVAWLLDEVRRRGDGCLCIVPWHPIFVATVAPVYRSNEIRSGRWTEAIEWTLANRPAAVMAPRFSGLVDRGVVTEPERVRMMNFLNQHYRLEPRGPVGFWLLRDGR